MVMRNDNQERQMQIPSLRCGMTSKVRVKILCLCTSLLLFSALGCAALRCESRSRDVRLEVVRGGGTIWSATNC
jgi:hypothetical protein